MNTERILAQDHHPVKPALDLIDNVGVGCQ